MDISLHYTLNYVVSVYISTDILIILAYFNYRDHAAVIRPILIKTTYIPSGYISSHSIS